MGCASSTESLSSAAEDEAEGTSDFNAPEKRKGKTNIKPNSNSGSGQKSTEQRPPADRSDSTKIRVIWRRVSIFGGGRRDSGRSVRSLDAELPGPSQNALTIPQEKTPKT